MESLSLYELNALVHRTLNESLDDAYWVHAELAEARQAFGGHFYVEFVQKDESGEAWLAKARGMMWRSTYAVLGPAFERATGQTLHAGLRVLVQVRVVFHELYGYSLQIVDIDPSYTLGDWARRRREILERLAADGILDDNRNLPLPMFMNRIAVVSSPMAAGYGDFCNQLLHNKYALRFHLHLFPAHMQGQDVERTVLSALETILQQADEWDAVVIIRGGGASSDLSDFDSYLLAAACAQFPLPVFTGIGHERDETVLDSVAHTRLKTPTAVAAFLVEHQYRVLQSLLALHTRIQTEAETRLLRSRHRLEQLTASLPVLFSQAHLHNRHQLQSLSTRLQHVVQHRLEQETARLDTYALRFRSSTEGKLLQAGHKLELLEQRVRASDPKLMLKRGYSLTQCNGKWLRNPVEVKSGDVLVTHLAEGEIRSTVE